MWELVNERTGLPPNQLQFGPRCDGDIDYHRGELEKVMHVLKPVVSFIEDAVSHIRFYVHKSLLITS